MSRNFVILFFILSVLLIPKDANAISVVSSDACLTSPTHCVLSGKATYEALLTSELGDVGGGTYAVGSFEAPSGSGVVETNTTLPANGFAGLTFEWNTNSTGTGTILASSTGATPLVYSFASGQVSWLVMKWTSVFGPGVNLVVDVQAVPLPAAGWLFITALLGFFGMRRFNFFRQAST